MTFICIYLYLYILDVALINKLKRFSNENSYHSTTSGCHVERHMLELCWFHVYMSINNAATDLDIANLSESLWQGICPKCSLRRSKGFLLSGSVQRKRRVEVGQSNIYSIRQVKRCQDVRIYRLSAYPSIGLTVWSQLAFN